MLINLSHRERHSCLASIREDTMHLEKYLLKKKENIEIPYIDLCELVRLVVAEYEFYIEDEIPHLEPYLKALIAKLKMYRECCH